MSLSEESGGDERRYRGKKMKDTKRSASVSSHEISPPSSPYMTPAHQHDPSKMVRKSSWSSMRFLNFNHLHKAENCNCVGIIIIDSILELHFIDCDVALKILHM